MESVMNYNSAREMLDSCTKRKAWITFFYFVLSIGVHFLIEFFRLNSLLYATVLLMAYIHYRLMKGTNRRKMLVLYRDLEAEKFCDIYNLLLRPDLEESVIAFTAFGKYQRAVNISANAFPKKKKHKLIHLECLGRTYFELDDTENLNKVLVKFYKTFPRRRRRYKNIYTEMDFYKEYALGNYQRCIALCKNKMAYLKRKSPAYNLQRARKLFDIGICYYKIGETENARVQFEGVVRFAPKLHVSRLSEQYIEKIDNRDMTPLNLPKIEAVPFSPGKPSCKRRKFLNFILTLIVLACTYLTVEPIVARIYCEKGIEQTLTERYGNYDIIGYTSVYDKKTDYLMCLVYSDNQFHLVACTLDRNGFPISRMFMEEMIPDTLRVFICPNEERLMYVGVYSKDNTYGIRPVKKIKIDDKYGKYVFYVERIEATWEEQGPEK